MEGQREDNPKDEQPKRRTQNSEQLAWCDPNAKPAPWWDGINDRWQICSHFFRPTANLVGKTTAVYYSIVARSGRGVGHSFLLAGEEGSRRFPEVSGGLSEELPPSTRFPDCEVKEEHPLEHPLEHLQPTRVQLGTEF